MAGRSVGLSARASQLVAESSRVARLIDFRLMDSLACIFHGLVSEQQQ